jgi:carboxyl-terminal processing protease
MFHLKRLTRPFLAVLILLGSLTTGLTQNTNAPVRTLKPGPNDPRIAYVTARLLEEYHYSQQPLDMAMSEKFFDGYFETLDPRHENFLQSDLNDFGNYRTNLQRLTINASGMADLTPAFQIFQRFLRRFQQHAAFVDDLLKQNKFKFTSDDQYLVDRRNAPYPKDQSAAEHLWRDRLRYEYLQEKLSREMSPTNSETLLPLTKSNLMEITDALARHNRWNLHMVTNWDSTDVLQAYLEALAHAYDPHSDYLNTEHAQDFSINMSLALFGIGAQLGEDDGYCTIRALIRGGPAAKSSQLKEGDRIVAVAQTNSPPVNVVDMELSKVVQLIRGVKGTEVRLTISPAEDRALRRVVTLIRDEIKLEDQEAKARLIEMSDGKGGTNRIGVIDLPSFYATIPLPGNVDHSTPKFTTSDVAKLVKKLKQEKVSGIILDLRSNPGGSLDEAVKFTGLFIKEGPVVLARSPEGPPSVDSDDDPSVLYSGPLAVMINRFSASASEIAAAALQDYGRAIVVGDISTHGKGTVQNLNQLRPFWPANSSATNDPGTVKITIRKFYRVTGASTQLRGVASDIVLPSVLNYSTQIGETSLENPLPWDVIASVKYDKLNLVQPYLDQLQKNSAARIATNQDYAYIRQDIEQFQKLQVEKSATLNERAALKERQANQARQKARDKEREARKASGLKVYEITVENADKPGLPEPLGQTNLGQVAASTNATTNVSDVAAKKPAADIDPALTETENVLEDYISLLSSNKTLIAN